MFSRKKKMWQRKEVYAGIGVAALSVFSLSLLFDTPEEVPLDNENSSEISQAVVKKSKSESKDYEDDSSVRNSQDVDEDKQYYESDEYYLIKEENGLIKIFQWDEETEEEKLIRTTDISYSLLYEDDQEMFAEGIKVETEEELMEILQDFES